MANISRGPCADDNRAGSNSWGDEQPDDWAKDKPFSAGKTSLFSTSRVLISVFTLVVLAAGLSVWLVKQNSALQRDPNRPPETTIGNAISSDGQPIELSVLHCPTGEVLLEHYDEAFEPVHGFALPHSGEFAKLHNEPGKPWYRGFERGMVLTSFNCAAFAVGPYLGLTTDDVLDGIARNGYGNPMEQILSSYFEPIGVYGLTSDDKRSFKLDSNLRQGDVVCFVEGVGQSMLHVHAGRVHKSEEGNLILSKFGRRGPILLADLPFVARHYPASELVVYRYRGPLEDGDAAARPIPLHSSNN